MPEIELLESSDSEAEAPEEAPEATEPRDCRAAHPAAFGTRIPFRHLEERVNHPASVRQLVRSAAKANELKEAGNARFKDKLYTEAIELYSDAIDYAPTEEAFASTKAVFFSNRAACLLKLDYLEDALEDCTEALELDPRYVRALMRRAQVHEKLEDLDSALADLKKALEVDPGYRPAVVEHARVDKLVTEKNEKMKEEMMGKLKDLGNTVLGKFGLSLNNFKAEKDPATGSYSVSFQQ